MLNKRELRKRVLLEGVGSVTRHLQRALRDELLSPEDFSIRDLAESLVVSKDGKPVGREWVDSMGPSKGGGLQLLEAASGVSLSAFSNITGQIIYERLMDSYQLEDFRCTDLVEQFQTNLNGQKVAGISGVTENVQEVKENMPFPEAGFGEDWIQYPETIKRGLIISVTKETLFFDLTSKVLQQAASVGEVMGRKKEKICARGMFGLDNSYNWKGTTYSTYQATTPWINSRSGVALADWTTIDGSEQLFNDLVEPNTGEPILVNANTILHMPARVHQFRQIVRATSLETRTASATEVRMGPNTLDTYTLVPSRFAYRELIAGGASAANAKDYWLLGDFKKAFGWQYNWPLTVVQAPQNAEAEFKQDIVLRWKASERGSFVVKEPRAVVRTYNA